MSSVLNRRENDRLMPMSRINVWKAQLEQHESTSLEIISGVSVKTMVREPRLANGQATASVARAS